MDKLTEPDSYTESDATTESIKKANIPTIGDMRLWETPFSQERTREFRNAFRAATAQLLPSEVFLPFAKEHMESGACFSSELLYMHTADVTFSIKTDNPGHLLLPNEYSYTAHNRPYIYNRTWFTHEERLHAAKVCSRLPEIPLSFMALLSTATDAILENRSFGQSRHGDKLSFMMRWSSGGPMNEVVVAFSIALLRDCGIPEGECEDERKKFIEQLLAKNIRSILADKEKMQELWEKTKQFLFNGNFFYSQQTDGNTTVDVTCPGKEFMNQYWHVQHEICKATQQHHSSPHVQNHCLRLKECFEKALQSTAS